MTAASEHRPLSMHADSYLLDLLKLLPESTPAIIVSVVAEGAWQDERIGPTCSITSASTTLLGHRH